MTAFSALPPETSLLLCGLLFLTAMAQLALCVYEQICHSRESRRAVDGAVFLLLLALASYLTAAVKKGSYPAAFPWLLVPIAALAVFLYAGTGMAREYAHAREKLSPASIQEALDDLKAGLLFADGEGRVVLINHRMARLAQTLIGSTPQMLGELEAALRPREGPALIHFPDGRVWRFVTVALSEPTLPGFTQTAAEDMTELTQANARLEEENEALRQAIEKTRQMLERVSERVREQETLELKMRVHDDIGTSLIALSKLMEEGSQTDPQAQLDTLEDAVSYFAGGVHGTQDVWEDVRRRAEEMGVTLELRDSLPAVRELQELIASAARECVTNCVRHAGGTRVTVTVREETEINVTFTNDGKAPSGPIVEGGGLSALHRRVENAGGQMSLLHAPRFSLLLIFPGKELAP